MLKEFVLYGLFHVTTFSVPSTDISCFGRRGEDLCHINGLKGFVVISRILKELVKAVQQQVATFTAAAKGKIYAIII